MYIVYMFIQAAAMICISNLGLVCRMYMPNVYRIIWCAAVADFSF